MTDEKRESLNVKNNSTRRDVRRLVAFADEVSGLRALGSWPVLLLALSVCLATIAAVTALAPTSSIDIVLLVIALGVVAGSSFKLASMGWSRRGSLVSLGVLPLLTVVGVLVANGNVVLSAQPYLFSVLTASILVTICVVVPRVKVWTMIVVGVLTVAVFVGAVDDVLSVRTDIDVVALHEQAAEALRERQSPYETGAVAVLETRQGDDVEIIREYTYPPATLMWYGVVGLSGADVRWAGAAGIVLTMVVLVVFGIVSTDRDRRLALLAVAALLANPTTLTMVALGWTEAVALPLFALAAATWRRYPTASALSFGVAIATKQYLLLGLPLLAAMPDSRRLQRVLLASASIAATVVPFAVTEPVGLFRGTILHHLSRPPRFDAATVAGLGLVVPSLAAIGAGLAIGLVIVRRGSGPGVAMLSLATAIGAFTLLAPRGFRNSWWIVFGMVVLAIVAGASDPPLDSSSITDEALQRTHECDVV